MKRLLAPSLLFNCVMKNKSINRYGAALLTACLLGSLFLVTDASAIQKPATTPPNPSMDRKTVAAFQDQAKSYVKLRNQVEGRLPKLSKDSTPEQIATHKKAFEDGVRLARANAKQGSIFTTSASEYLRRLIRTEFKGQDRKEVKETILDAETAGVPLKVNYPYPESKEVTAIPPTLLLTLPQLPKELNYRFVGRHMVLIDKENGLILDYLLNALP